MTEEESQLLSVFESRLHQLMSSHNDLRLQVAALQVLNKKLETENCQLKEQYDNLKIARIISIKQDDFKGAKNALFLLIKEVDKCMALLNE